MRQAGRVTGGRLRWLNRCHSPTVGTKCRLFPLKEGASPHPGSQQSHEGGGLSCQSFLFFSSGSLNLGANTSAVSCLWNRFKHATVRVKSFLLSEPHCTSTGVFPLNSLQLKKTQSAMWHVALKVQTFTLEESAHLLAEVWPYCFNA